MLYKQIGQNKRNTWLAIGGYVLILGAAAWFIDYLTDTMAISCFFLGAGLIYLAYIYFDATRHFMKITGGVEVSREEAPELYELVEEMSLAAGLPMPKVYVVPLAEPNAFATGRDPEHASLAVTSGLLRLMNKKELLGVIGHEMSHIRNYDMRVTTISSGLYTFILLAALGLTTLGLGCFTTKVRGCISAIILWCFGAFFLAVGLALLLVALPLAYLLNLATSRQREYLADVGSVDLTRDPSCIISALEKLEEFAAEAEKTAKEDQAADFTAARRDADPMVRALAFNVFKGKHFWANLFSDHPTLDRRIARLQESMK